MFSTKTIALFAAVFGMASAADVYSTFFDASGQQVGGVNYDVGNDGCFQNSGSTQIKFSQSGAISNPEGPYCLRTFTASDCSGDAQGSQQFAGVNLDQFYVLNQDVVGPFHTWSTASC